MLGLATGSSASMDSVTSASSWRILSSFDLLCQILAVYHLWKDHGQLAGEHHRDDGPDTVEVRLKTTLSPDLLRRHVRERTDDFAPKNVLDEIGPDRKRYTEIYDLDPIDVFILIDHIEYVVGLQIPVNDASRPEPCQALQKLIDHHFYGGQGEVALR